MPATVTHAYFAADIYDVLDDNIKKKLSLLRLKTFGQSTDPLIFYRLLSIRSGKNIRQLQHTFHTEKTQDFFINLITYIKNNKLENDIDTCSFLCGFICHYVLDYTIHPFVYYKTGQFNKRDASTYKYNNQHLFMETYLDNHLIKKREKKNPYSFSIDKFCFDLQPFSASLRKTIHYSFQKTYNISNMDTIYYQSLKDMRFCLRYLRQDKLGIKKFFYKIADSFTPNNWFRFEAISYHYPLYVKRDFLNFEHRLWRNPTSYSMISYDSFYDLYIKALKSAKRIIDKTFAYLNNENVDLQQLYSNISYVTGLDCNCNKKLQFFEF